jgi:ferrous-iron efflux pump FieF
MDQRDALSMSGLHGHNHGSSNGHAHTHGHGTLTTRAALASVSVALFLLVIKIYAAAETGSVAMLGSLADTGLDLIASLVTLFAVRYAMQPADNEHRFGHGKAEALSALFQVTLIAMSALVIGWRAIERLHNNEGTSQPEYGIGVSLIAIAVTLVLLVYQKWVINRTGSVAIGADHMHYQTDLLLNVAVIAAIVLDNILSIKGADALFGIVIAAWLLWGAWRAASTAIDHLMDREWPLEKRQRFLEVAQSHPELKGIHDMRTRSSGSDDFVQFHAWVNPKMTVEDAHRVMDEVEAKLMLEFPGVEVLIHPDPEGHTDDIGYIPSESSEHDSPSHGHEH